MVPSSQSILYDVGKDAMENEEHAVIVWCRPDPQTNIAQMRVVNVATGEEVPLQAAKCFHVELAVSLSRSTLVTRYRVIEGNADSATLRWKHLAFFSVSR